MSAATLKTLILSIRKHWKIISMLAGYPAFFSAGVWLMYFSVAEYVDPLVEFPGRYQRDIKITAANTAQIVTLYTELKKDHESLKSYCYREGARQDRMVSYMARDNPNVINLINYNIPVFIDRDSVEVETGVQPPPMDHLQPASDEVCFLWMFCRKRNEKSE